MKLKWELLHGEIYAVLECGAVIGVDRYGNVLIHDPSMVDVGVEIGEVAIYNELGKLRIMDDVCDDAEAIVQRFAESLVMELQK